MLLKLQIHDSSPLSARGAMALKLSESQFPHSSGQCIKDTTAHTVQWFPRLVGPRGFTHSATIPSPNWNPKLQFDFSFKMSTDKISNQRPSTKAVPSDYNVHQLTLTLIFMQLLKSYWNHQIFQIIDKLPKK